MSRRIEIELTSQRPDGSWTWRAAGAREPKGELAGDLIAFAASVGDELTVEAEFHMDGIEIIEAFESKKKRPLPETLEILGSGRDQPLVTTQLFSKRKGRERDRGDRRGREERRSRGDKKDHEGRESRREDDRPKAKRLRPGRTHRQSIIDGLSEDQKSVAEKIARDGVSSVEQALRDKRKKARDAAAAKKKSAESTAKDPDPTPTEPGTPPAEQAETKPADKQPADTKPADKEPADDFLSAAAKLLPRMRAAEWRDRVEAALVGIDEGGPRGLRFAVVAAPNGWPKWRQRWLMGAWSERCGSVPAPLRPVCRSPRTSLPGSPMRPARR